MTIGKFPERLPNVEAEIINRVITGGLENGGSISVYDGEEWPLVKSKSRNKIQSEVAATDETTLRFYNKNGDRVGFVWLIHGNMNDVISDHSDNVATCELLMQALEYAEGC